MPRLVKQGGRLIKKSGRLITDCDCCGPGEEGECPLCDSETLKDEYDIRFWPGKPEESLITVSNPRHIPDPEFGYGCCNWDYVGVLSDIQGIADDGLGECAGDAPLNVSLQLCRKAATETLPARFYWLLVVRIPCDPNIPNRKRGQITAAVTKFEGDDVATNLTVTCDLEGAERLTFDDGYAVDPYDDCGGGAFAFAQGCLDCETNFPNPFSCDFPDGDLAIVENAA